MSSSLALQNKSIVVVGAAGNIGQCIVQALLNAGATVTALDRNVTALNGLRELCLSSNGQLLTLLVDISDRASIKRAMASAEVAFGVIDGAVNTTYPRNDRYGRHFFDVQYADFCENVGMHMGGYFLFMQACARYALDHQSTFSLVNVSSIYGSIAPRFDVYEGTPMTMPVEYSAIKSGVEHMTRYVNAYMKGKQASFRANCVSPGGILAGQHEQFLTQYKEHCLSKGMLSAEDITGTVIFLLSDASRYLAGQNLVVDDGFSL